MYQLTCFSFDEKRVFNTWLQWAFMSLTFSIQKHWKHQRILSFFENLFPPSFLSLFLIHLSYHTLCDSWWRSNERSSSEGTRDGIKCVRTRGDYRLSAEKCNLPHGFALWGRKTSLAKLWKFEWNPADYLKQPLQNLKNVPASGKCESTGFKLILMRENTNMVWTVLLLVRWLCLE